MLRKTPIRTYHYSFLQLIVVRLQIFWFGAVQIQGTGTDFTPRGSIVRYDPPLIKGLKLTDAETITQYITLRPSGSELSDAIREALREILRDVSWRVNRGEHWTLLGANGSGKTSLLNVLLGYLTPTSGSVRVACGW